MCRAAVKLLGSAQVLCCCSIALVSVTVSSKLLAREGSAEETRQPVAPA